MVQSSLFTNVAQPFEMPPYFEVAEHCTRRVDEANHQGGWVWKTTYTTAWAATAIHVSGRSAQHHYDDDAHITTHSTQRSG